MSGPRVYIHELVEIRDHSRANYMHHITANWSPIGQAEREQLCFGIWGTVGSTARWPEVVNMWEYRDWAHLARNFQIEFDHPTLQDPSLAPWWAEAVNFRRGGFDRILIGADWNPGVEALCARAQSFAVYAHELVTLPPGAAPELLKRAHELALPAYAGMGATLVGAFRTGMVDDSECIFLWGFETWDAWASFESDQETDAAHVRWRSAARELDARMLRFLLADAPLSPLRIHRQPRETDRRPLE